MTLYLHRGYEIYFDPKPVPEKTAGGWSFVHYDYDGAPNSEDHRCGDGRSVSDCKQQIDEMENEK